MSFSPSPEDDYLLIPGIWECYMHIIFAGVIKDFKIRRLSWIIRVGPKGNIRKGQREIWHKENRKAGLETEAEIGVM